MGKTLSGIALNRFPNLHSLSADSSLNRGDFFFLHNLTFLHLGDRSEYLDCSIFYPLKNLLHLHIDADYHPLIVEPVALLPPVAGLISEDSILTNLPELKGISISNRYPLNPQFVKLANKWVKFIFFP